MDLSLARGQLTQEEKGRRLVEGLCLYCGGHGHLACNCPNKPQPSQPSQRGPGRSLRAAAAATIETHDSDPMALVTLSGKEQA